MLCGATDFLTGTTGGALSVTTGASPLLIPVSDACTLEINSPSCPVGTLLFDTNADTMPAVSWTSTTFNGLAPISQSGFDECETEPPDFPIGI